MGHNIFIEDRVYTLYEKSIKVEGLARVFFYNRKVGNDDASQLHALYKLGQQVQKESTKEAIRKLGIF